MLNSTEPITLPKTGWDKDSGTALNEVAKRVIRTKKRDALRRSTADWGGAWDDWSTADWDWKTDEW